MKFVREFVTKRARHHTCWTGPVNLYTVKEIDPPNGLVITYYRRITLFWGKTVRHRHRYSQPYLPVTRNHGDYHGRTSGYLVKINP